MKRLLFAVLVLALCSAYVLPPALPSSFWGYVVNIPAGENIQVSQNGIILAQAQVRDFGVYGLAYQVDVTFGVDNVPLQFRYHGALVGSGIYHTGTNQRVDLTRLVPGTIRKGK